MGFWVGFNSRNPSKSLKSGGFIQENAKKRDFLHTWGFIQEWRCIEADTVVGKSFDIVVEIDESNLDAGS